MGQNSYTFDVAGLLKDAGAITSSAACQVASVDKVMDLGKGRVLAVVKAQVSAIDVSSGNELYGIELQFSNSSTFASGVVTGPVLQLGDNSVVPSNSVDSVVGEYEFAFTNEINGTRYQYVRGFTRAAGTTPSINYTLTVYSLPAVT